MKKRHGPAGKPVSSLVHAILEQAHKSKADGPSSALYSHRAQLSSSLNQAGSLLAKMDRADPPRKSSMIHTILGLAASAKEKPERRSWFFASAKSDAMPNARRIEQLLKATAKDGKRLAFDAPPSALSGQEDLHCVLPEGASDPVCEPRS